MPAPSVFSGGVVDNFTRANSLTSLGPGWTNFHPGGSLGYIADILGVSSNQGYDSNTTVANKAGSCWNTTQTGEVVEAYMTLSVLPGDWAGLLLRCTSVNTPSSKGYTIKGCHPVNVYEITRLDSSTSETVLSTGSMSGWVSGDLIGARCYTNNVGNVVIELWRKHSAGAWTLLVSTTDSSASKLTANGFAGVIWGNAAGSSVGRFDDFSVATSVLTFVDLGLSPSIASQKIIDAQGTSFSLVPNSIGNIIASAGITAGLTPALTNQKLVAAGVVNLTLTPTAAAVSVAVSQAAETDTAFAVRAVRSRVVGQALESDSASAIQGRTVVSVTQATETDATRPLIGSGRSFSVAQATETDSAQAAKHIRLENVTQPTVTNTGQPVTHRKTIRPSQVIETELAQAVARVRTIHVGQALEVDLGQGVTHGRTFHVGQVVEGDTAQTVVSVRTFHVGEATETEQSQAATHKRVKHVGQAQETDTPLPFPKFINVGQALETDLGRATVVRRSFHVGQGLELDGASAFAFTRGHTHRVRTGQDFAFSPHANPKKTGHAGIVKRVRIAYEAVYSHPVHER